MPHFVIASTSLRIGLTSTTRGKAGGAAISHLGLPTLLVQEGGYLSDELGDNLTSFLQGFETA